MARSDIRDAHRRASTRGSAATGLLILSLVLPALLAGCGGSAVQPTATPQPAPTSTAVPVPTSTPTPGPAVAPYWPTTGWRTSTPEEQGIDSTQLASTLKYVDAAGINIRSMTIVRNGYIVMEAYNRPYTANQKYQVYSVTKSVTGALIGIAIHEGYIKDVDQKVLDFFPGMTIANLDTAKQAISIEDLLTMQPGLDCADDRLNFKIEQSKNWVQSILDLPMAEPPGQKMVYCTVGVHLLSAILTKATGMSTEQYAWSRLFTPLGIKHEDLTWGSDPQGITIGGYGISMKPRDMAKFGLLYLNGGKWDGVQIVPADWVATSARVHAIYADGRTYGYLFWVYPTHYAAQGLGEQTIQIIKDRNMVEVLTSAINNGGPALLSVLKDHVLPAARSDGVLPANPAGYDSLQAQIKYMANPVQPVPPLPAIARTISGRTYVIDENQAGWNRLTLNFEEGKPEASASVESTGGTITATLGLDNVYRVMQMPGNAWTAFRGRWVDDHTFVVHQLNSSPDIQEAEIRIEFTGNEVKIHATESVFNTYTYDMHGVAKP